MPFEKHDASPTDSKTEREKELRRVYRKIRGVRSELSVKLRKLKMESSKADSPLEDDIVLDDKMETEPIDNGSDSDSGETSNHSIRRSPIDAAQYEVKSLLDQKNRLRKRFWKLQKEVHRKSA